MAIVTRLYVEKGPSNGDLARYAAPSASAAERFRSPVVIVQYDNTAPDPVNDIDQYMDMLGYDPSAGDDLSISGFARPGNPGAVAGRAIFFARTFGGVTNWYARTDDGAVIQLTPTQSPAGYISGLVLSFTSLSTVTIGVGRARDKNNNKDLILAAPVVLNIAAAGVNGLDTGVEAANTWYHAYVIGDTTGVNPTAGILSTNQNAPTFPAGYDVARRVGSVRNNGTDFRDFQAFGDGSSRVVEYRDALSTRQRLTGGAATVVTTVSCGAVIPQTSQLGHFQMQQRGTVVASIYDDPTQTLGNAQRTIPVGGSLYDQIRTSSGRDIAYSNAAAGGLLDVFVTGYEESV